MAVIPGVNIRWDLSPRLIILPLAVRSVSAQDLVDTLREAEATWNGMDEVDTLIFEASGKTALDSVGTQVGITVTMLNAQLYFTPPTTPRSDGTATAIDADGELLTDGTVDFIALGIERGDTLFNADAGAMATVLEFTATTVTTLPMTGGWRSDWQIGDSWVLYRNDPCNVDGGNVVAIDDAVLQNFISPIFQSPNTQVVRTSSSSATLQELDAIQYASYNDGVTIDAILGGTGTAYPMGTVGHPVNNLADAIVIATAQGFTNLYFKGNFTFGPTTYLLRYMLWGQGWVNSLFTFQAGCITAYCGVRNAKITGATLGITSIEDCNIENYGGSGLVPSSQEVVVRNCMVEGSISLPSNYTGIIHVLDCWSVGLLPVAFNMNGGAFSIIIENMNGSMEVRNCTEAANHLHVGLKSGTLTITASCTAGHVQVGGVGLLVNDQTGTLTVNSDALVSTEATAQAILTAVVEAGLTVEEALRILLSVSAGKSSGFPFNPVFRDMADTKDRIVATLNASGDRLTVTRDGT